ncbi:hypothetical protein HPB49_026001 [Dermacentor silvarum]|nr:hypothetical protein HPB49_026001 [Dermacentor silvarum]
MDMDDQAIETQVGSAADAEEEFLSPDEVVQGESTSDDDAEEISPREDDEAKNGQWQLAISLRERKRLRKQVRAAPDDSGARDGGKGNSCDARTPAGERDKRGGASARNRRRTRAAPLPRNDIKIIMRPKPGLIVKELKTYEVARAIERASGDPETCKSDKFLLRLRNASNIIIASTPHEQVAEKILKIKTLDLNGTKHPINTYITTPEGYLKGVIHGLERETPEDELLSNLRVRTQGVTIVQARMLGNQGNRRKLSLCIAMMGMPRVLFLDEPYVSVGSTARKRIVNYIHALQKVSKMSIVLASHSLSDVEFLCNRIAIMADGRLQCLGSLARLKRKFGKGYTITVKTYPDRKKDYIYQEGIAFAVTDSFPTAELGLLEFRMCHVRLQWSEMFSRMAFIKKKFKLQDFFITDTSLEQIFLSVTRKEASDAAAAAAAQAQSPTAVVPTVVNTLGI